MEHLQPQYITSSLCKTKTYLASIYQSSPIKAPSFVESTIKKIDQVTEPYITQATTVVDSGVNKSYQVVQPYSDKAKALGQHYVVDKYSELKKQGREQISNVQAKSHSLVNSSVDLAIHNKASQIVISSADTITDKVFTSIEDRIVQLKKLFKVQERSQEQTDEGKQQDQPNVEKRGSLHSYHNRVIDLAQGISQLSNQLYVVLKQEVGLKQHDFRVQLRVGAATTWLQAHFVAVSQVITVSIFLPTLAFLSSSKTILKEHLQTIRQKYTDQEFCEYVKEQLSVAKGYLSKQQLQNIYHTLREINYIKSFRSGFDLTKKQYQLSLEKSQKSLQNKQQEFPPQQENKEEDLSL